MGLVALSCVTAGAIRRSRAERFRTACAATTGASYRDAVRSLTGFVAPVTQVEESPHDPGGSVSFRTRFGLGSFCTCSIRLAADRVVAQTFTTGHDLERCTDRGAYPRRWWLCELGVAVIP